MTNLITLLAPNYANKPLTSSLVGSIDRVSEKRNESNLISLFVWKAFGTLLFCVVHYWTWTVWLLLVLMVIVWLHCTFADSTFQGILAHLGSYSVTICIYWGTFYVCVHCYVGFYTFLINLCWFFTFSWLVNVSKVCTSQKFLSGDVNECKSKFTVSLISRLCELNEWGFSCKYQEHKCN